MQRLFLDLETFSPIPISRGTDVYSREAEIMLVTYALDDEPVKLHDFTEDPQIPEDLLDHLHNSNIVKTAHNAYFEQTLTRNCWLLDIPPKYWHCTMAQALAHSLPAGLEQLCEVLRLDVRKQEDGKKLIHLFCKPQGGKRKLQRATAHTHPEEWERFKSYAITDTEAMRAVFKAMPSRNYKGAEKRLWDLDQAINLRGFYADLELCDAAIAALKADKQTLDDRVYELTDGEVSAATQRDKLLLHLCNEHGVLLPGLRAKDIEEALDSGDLPAHVQELLKIRLEAAMASTAKYSRLRNTVGPDGRLRGTLQYCGAMRTGRYAGRIFQPQNMKRPTMKADDIEHCITLLKRGRADLIPFFAGSLREAASNATRGLIIAPPGKLLRVCDWSNIEGRMAAWVAGEHWKLQAFRDFDTIIPGEFDAKGKPRRAGPDLYNLAYSRAFNVNVNEVNGEQRQIGKVQELGLQYGGGVGAFASMALVYNMDLKELARLIPKSAPWEQVARSQAIWERAVKKKRALGFDQDVYVACETIKHLYRTANSAIEKSWGDLESAAKQAVLYPGDVFHAAKCKFTCRSGWLMCLMPSGRTLMYPSPRVSDKGVLSYMAPKNKRWVRTTTYGGKLLENIVQALSRDIMRDAQLRMADEYPDADIVLHVHDEIIAETRIDGGMDLAQLKALMEVQPDWCPDIPLAAEGFEAHRYAKH